MSRVGALKDMEGQQANRQQQAEGIHCEHHELPNVCAKSLWDFSEGAGLPEADASPRPTHYRILETGFFIRLIPYIIRDSVVLTGRGRWNRQWLRKIQRLAWNAWTRAATNVR